MWVECKFNYFFLKLWVWGLIFFDIFFFYWFLIIIFVFFLIIDFSNGCDNDWEMLLDILFFLLVWYFVILFIFIIVVIWLEIEIICDGLFCIFLLFVCWRLLWGRFRDRLFLNVIFLYYIIFVGWVFWMFFIN